MTREEQIKIVTDARDRAFKQIELTEGCEMSTEDFLLLLRAAQELGFMSSQEASAPEPLSAAPVAPEQAQIEEHSPVDVFEETPVVPAANTPSKAEVRDKLSAYSNKYDALDVASIMADMGYGKLSDIPATKYSELLERVEAVIAGYM